MELCEMKWSIVTDSICNLKYEDLNIGNVNFQKAISHYDLAITILLIMKRLLYRNC